MDNDFVTAIAAQWRLNVQTDLTRYVIFAIAVWLVLWVVLAGALSGRKIREATPPAKQLPLEFLISLRSIAGRDASEPDGQRRAQGCPRLGRHPFAAGDGRAI